MKRGEVPWENFHPYTYNLSNGEMRQKEEWRVTITRGSYETILFNFIQIYTILIFFQFNSKSFNFILFRLVLFHLFNLFF